MIAELQNLKFETAKEYDFEESDDLTERSESSPSKISEE